MNVFVYMNCISLENSVVLHTAALNKSVQDINIGRWLCLGAHDNIVAYPVSSFPHLSLIWSFTCLCNKLPPTPTTPHPRSNQNHPLGHQQLLPSLKHKASKQAFLSHSGKYRADVLICHNNNSMSANSLYTHTVCFNIAW